MKSPNKDHIKLFVPIEEAEPKVPAYILLLIGVTFGFFSAWLLFA